MVVILGRRRSLEAARAKMSITVSAESRAVIARAGEACSLADGTVAAMAVERGLPTVFENRRKRAERAVEREAGLGAAKCPPPRSTRVKVIGRASRPCGLKGVK